MKLGRTRFETELAVRPDDIDMNQHVHGSRYQDYVLTARYDQMARCYGMAMDEFTKLGLGWVIRTAHLDYKRALRMGDTMIVRTWVEEMFKDGVRVHFEIVKQPAGKLACDGWFHYTMVNTTTGRAEELPAEVVKKYSV
jgi:YbgC/YbaW family acyl-CoA thioester hydrolase